MVRSDIELDDPFLVEGLPGLGLASKIAADHLIDALDMEPYAAVEAEGLPEVAMFEAGDHAVRPPVQLFASAEHDLLVLTADVLVSPLYAQDFSDLVVGWIAEQEVTPLFCAGLPVDEDTNRLYGVSTGGAAGMLDDADVAPPDGPGLVGGPTGALLRAADDRGMEAAGLIVETDPQFPDPAAARVLIDDGVEPIAGFDIETDVLTERAEQIREQKEQFAQMVRRAEQHERGEAFPEGMYQ